MAASDQQRSAAAEDADEGQPTTTAARGQEPSSTSLGKRPASPEEGAADANCNKGGGAGAAAPTAGQQVRRSKKSRGKAGGSAAADGAADANGNGSAAGPPQEEYVRVVPVPKKATKLLQEGWRPVALSKHDKAAQMTLGDDGRSVTSCKGFRTARATHGVAEGTWYFEVAVTRLGETGHARLGWAKKKGELQAPVGYDAHSFGYRDVDGSKVHKAWREDYGAPFKEGDVIGCLLHLPPGGRRMERSSQDIVRWKGGLYYVDEPEPEARPLPGSVVGFARNGEWQGPAYAGVLEGCYYPAVSLYTRPEQREGATVTLNFGPDFQYPPPAVDGIPAPKPMCDAAGPKPTADDQGNDAGDEQAIPSSAAAEAAEAAAEAATGAGAAAASSDSGGPVAEVANGDGSRGAATEPMEDV